MTDLGSTRLRATTVTIDDPGPLHRFLSASEPSAAFIREGDGFVALGEMGRFETDFAAAADVWWTEIASHIDHDTELPGAYGVGPLAVGTFAFDADRSQERSVLIVPEVIVGRRRGQSWLTRLSTGRARMELPPVGEPLTPPQDLRLDPGAVRSQEWAGVVGEVLRLIESGEVRKVVLARDLLVHASAELDLRAILRRLIELYPSCWSYLLDGMVGATPEMLIRRQGTLVTSRVLAGTVSVDPSHTDALQASTALAQSHKDAAEHEFAVESVRQALEPYCSAMHVPESPAVLALPNVLHLSTDVTGVCEPDTTSLALAGALHPSAAVCGTPTFAASNIISDLETVDRGRYAGPIGWTDASGDGEWYLALRGGQRCAATPEQLRLFAGAGIVANSDPEKELLETRAKFVPMLQALGLEPTSTPPAT